MSDMEELSTHRHSKPNTLHITQTQNSDLTGICLGATVLT